MQEIKSLLQRKPLEDRRTVIRKSRSIDQAVQGRRGRLLFTYHELHQNRFSPTIGEFLPRNNSRMSPNTLAGRSKAIG